VQTLGKGGRKERAKRREIKGEDQWHNRTVNSKITS
jgi:hypothetical protein